MPAQLLFALGVGADVMSSMMEGYAAEDEAKAEARQLERNAAIAEQHAIARLEKARFDSRRAARFGEATMGELTAQLGASGARLDVGAPVALLAEQAGELELEQFLIFDEAETEAKRLRQQAEFFRIEAKRARKRGKAARRASLFSAFGKGARAFGTGSSLGFFGGDGGSQGSVIEARDTQGSVIEAEDKTARRRTSRVRRITLSGRSGKSLGTLRGRSPTKGGFAGTNRSSVTRPGTTTA